MRDRGNFKSQVLSSQKLRKRRAKAGRSRYRIDLIELHRDIAETGRRRRPITYTRIKGGLFALAAIPVFFLLGYLISGLPVPIWAKVLLLTLVAVLGFVSSYLVAALFR
jgi:hypothetical protein